MTPILIGLCILVNFTVLFGRKNYQSNETEETFLNNKISKLENYLDWYMHLVEYILPMKSLFRLLNQSGAAFESRMSK